MLRKTKLRKTLLREEPGWSRGRIKGFGDDVALGLASRGQAGFSLIEGLVAIAVLLIIVVGIIPLFTQAMVSNAAGRHMTQASNFASDGFETLLQMPLNNELLTVPVGDMGVATIQLFAGREAVSESADSTKASASASAAPSGDALQSNVLLASYTTGLADAADPSIDDLISEAQGADGTDFSVVNLNQADWARRIIVRQFSISSLSDGIVDDADQQLTESEMLSGGTNIGNVHLKRIEIRIEPRGRADALNLGRGQITATVLKAF